MNTGENSENSLKQVLLQAAEDLYYPSESDEPFAYFEWDFNGTKPLNEIDVKRFAQQTRQTPVEIQSVDDFFKRVTEVKEWYHEEEIKLVDKFKILKEKIISNLSNVQVYKLGRKEIEAYIVGKTPTGKWAGLSTKLTET
ncbi:nuclease A inhibitor family protein [Cytophagaceae bacterium DM2B3-1]|uniref:Nuclease A inhibitor family protein n=2 Tax=Xanthocytophaga TaxID=3078918 RepID=A0AAE3QLP9_9BACT|nr:MULTISPECIES: nuclease A inhibitor family protein [Xanthocytophaga]MDJ1466577.1 nuclease A inhibitor family protein [Xanthocytophaga flavus]MDJ1479231.1 nuclease A inhibitor family protein [Xanthocytophaga flavus]MDJ1492575.1 nuclease A inhibitor family protein [Xanthocytophaga flavus]MDJ1500795.1 nuclease A inhibitor family protein [Xanthocytophaga agilis]